MRKREGIEPRYGYETVGADMLSFIEGNIKGADETMAPANSLGSKTVARHQGRVGNSGGPMGSSREGRRAAQPDNREEAPTTHGKSDALVRATKWGNAPRAKGGTDGGPLDGDAAHTQRWTCGDHGSRADSHTGSQGAADALYRADVPLHVGTTYGHASRRWTERRRLEWMK